MYLLNHFFQINGLVWAIPLADLGALIIAVSMVAPLLKALRNESVGVSK